jgi:hypothetical protein
LLGGSFGGLAGQLIGVVALLSQVGAAMAGWIAGAAGLTLLVSMFKDIAAAAERAAGAQREYNAAVREAQEVRGERLATLGEQLESYGMRSEATVRNAEEIWGKLGEVYGFTGARGTRAAALAAAIVFWPRRRWKGGGPDRTR